eukprot:FR736323.1.p1 GENE.FR736323.1~~FR736323.1.p1  ORF type:complete len:119 (+),score=13.66 FR736323.1:220-576(+)
MMQHATSQRVYAMKSLRKANIVEKNLQQRTLNEISILERMDHGFILRLFCTLQDVKCVHMVLELVQGGELFTHLEQQVRFDDETAKFYTCQILLALEYMHVLPIVYKDLKPENLELRR